ncbi:MAG: serine/threonine protein kinase [Myxococcales bacterium]|nr:serine/threonine protein kinase [Myxococcales bacterium]
MTKPGINREKVSGEALFILRNLKENGRLGRSNKLADVKTALEPSVSLEFDSYFFFLRKFHYIAMDREAQLKLTDQGERVVEGEHLDKFTTEVGDFFADQLSPGEDNTQSGPLAVAAPPPIAGVSTDILLDETDMAPPPPPPPSAPPPARSGRKPPAPALDEPLAPPPAPQVTSRVEVPDLKRESGFAGQAAAQASAQQKGTDIDLRYVKFDPIGSGPLGTVFKGRHNALGLDICVKELKDIFGYFSFLQRGEVIKRLKKELCAQAQVRHPAVVAVLDQNTEVARPYFVMELLRGSLREKLDQAGGKGIPVPQAVRYFLQICYALRSAHALGLTHHNIKPENVLFDGFGNAKIGDFGLARVIEVDQSKGMPQVFVGTGGMGYMAPELISRNKDVGNATDVYGVGILLYEMLTGQIPGRRSPLPSELNNEVPSKLDPIFDKMTQDRKDSRYPDFDSMLDDFYGAFSDGEYLTKSDLILWSEAKG